MNSSDVIVVGGGPGGSTCARWLVESGLSVRLLDKARFPRDKVCAGWITPAVVEEVGLDLDAYRAAGLVMQPITRFRVGQIGGTSIVDVDYDRPASYGILRREFDHYLLRQCPADIVEGIHVRDIERVDGRWIVNDAYEAPMLVGAGGHFCPVHRLLQDRANADAASASHGNGTGDSRRPRGPSVVAAQEVEIPLSPEQQRACSVSGDAPEIYFSPDLRGYGWAFRKGDHLNVGLGRDDHGGVSQNVAAFCRFLQDRHRVGWDAWERFHGHAYRLYDNVPPRLVDDGVLLIGDSAGLAYPQSGEGIRPAIESAMLAAETIRDVTGQTGGACPAELLRSYEDKLAARFGKRRIKKTESARGGKTAGGAGEGHQSNGKSSNGHVAATSMPSWKMTAASWLLRQKWFVRRFVLERWFLHTQQQPLVMCKTS